MLTSLHKHVRKWSTAALGPTTPGSRTAMTTKFCSRQDTNDSADLLVISERRGQFQDEGEKRRQLKQIVSFREKIQLVKNVVK